VSLATNPPQPTTHRRLLSLLLQLSPGSGILPWMFIMVLLVSFFGGVSGKILIVFPSLTGFSSWPIEASLQPQLHFLMLAVNFLIFWLTFFCPPGKSPPPEWDPSSLLFFFSFPRVEIFSETSSDQLELSSSPSVYSSHSFSPQQGLFPFIF